MGPMTLQLIRKSKSYDKIPRRICTMIKPKHPLVLEVLFSAV